MILDGTLDASVQAAARALQQGQLLGLPTETVYGLAADSDNDAAVAQIFAAKGRPAARASSPSRVAREGEGAKRLRGSLYFNHPRLRK